MLRGRLCDQGSRRGHQYSRKVLTETRRRTTGLSFNVRVLYQLSYLDRLLIWYLNLKVVLITRALFGVFSATRGRQGSYMYVGSYRHVNKRTCEQKDMCTWGHVDIGHVDTRTYGHVTCGHEDICTWGHVDMWTCVHEDMRLCGHEDMRISVSCSQL